MKNSGVASTKTAGRKRKILLGLGLGLLGLILLILAAPVWFPWILRPIARTHGVDYATYERIGYTRFALRTVTFTNRTVEVRAGHVEALFPTVWLWQRYTADASQPFLRAANWQLKYKRTGGETKKPPSSVYTSFHQVEKAIATLQDWLPAAQVTNGTIEGAGRTLEVPVAAWTRGIFTAHLLLPQQHSGTLVAKWRQTVPLEIRFASDSLDLDSTVHILEDATGLKIESTHHWLTNTVKADAWFGREGVLPDKATVRADAFVIPAQRLNLRPYEALQGSASLTWQNGQFAVNVTAAARPLVQGDLPPVNIQVRAGGDPRSAQIETLRVTAPWLELELASPVKVSLTSPYLFEATTLRIAADLSQQSWFPAEGQLDGRAAFQPAAAKFPDVSFALSGSGIAISNLQTRMLNLNGQFAWPWLELTNARIELADGAVAQCSGKLDVTNKVIRDGRVQFQGWLGRDWLPAGYAYENASLSATFGGPLQNLSHAGQTTIDEMVIPRLKPLRLEARWQGEGLHFQQCQIQLASGKSSLQLQGAVDAGRPVRSAHITALTLTNDGQRALELAAPFRLSLQVTNLPSKLPGANVARAQVLNIEPLHWLGRERELRLQAALVWPYRGRLESSIKAIDLALFGDFVKLPDAHLVVQQLHLAAAWTNSPVHFRLELAADAALTNGLPLTASARLHSDRDGIALDELSLASQTQITARAHGFLPLAIHPDRSEERIQFHERKPLQLEVATDPNAFFWNELAGWSGVNLQKPDLQIHVDGTWGSPKGEVSFRAERIQIRGTNRPLPAMENLRLSLHLDQNVARLSELQLFVEEQLLTLTGSMPLEKEFWLSLGRKTPALDWKKITARLQARDAQLVSFASFVPGPLVPEGRINVDLSLRPGAKLDGELTLEGLRTRPLEGIGPIRDIQGRLRFAGNAARLESLTALVGGQPVMATGHIDLPVAKWPQDGTLPAFELQLQGTNVPLARKPELILRADLNLAAVKSTSKQPPVIRGTVRLRDSYYLSDLNDLVPGRVAAAQRRPPYFSIEEEPFSHWRLNVNVQGEKFLRVRSPLFRGEASAHLQLTGTLKDPVALGEAKIDSGTVILPFASLEVKQGLVTLTSENAYRPQLFVTASTKRIGYDIQMELTGPADKPIVQFSSSPPLSSEQIVLMVMAGQMPRDVASLSTEQRAQRFALFLGKGILSQFGVGTKQERVTIRAGEELTEQGKPTYEVEYRLNRKFSLVGQYDRFSEYNAGVRWRIYSR